MRFLKVCHAILSARDEGKRLEGGSCRREQSDIEWAGVGRQTDRQAGRQAGKPGM